MSLPAPLVTLSLALAGPAHAVEWDDLRWVRVGEDGSCETKSQTGYRVEVGADTVKRRDDLAGAIDALKKQTEDALVDRACSGAPKATCDAIRRRVGFDSVHDPKSKKVCVAAMVSAKVLNDPSGHAAAAKTLAGAAAQARASAGERPVAVTLPRWSTQCGTGGAGGKLRQALEKGFVQAGATVQRPGPGVVLIEPVIAPGDPVELTLWATVEPGQPSGVVATASVSAAWLGVLGQAGQGCSSTEALRLGADGRRVGADGLDLRWQAGMDRALCPGERVEARLGTSRPARVQVLSLARTGEAWLGYVPSGGRGVLERSTSLTLEAAYVPDLGQELMIAVAVPADSDALLPAGRGGVGCRIEAFDPKSVPDDAAVAVFSFDVLPPGREACEISEPDAKSAVWEYRAAPPCPRPGD